MNINKLPAFLHNVIVFNQNKAMFTLRLIHTCNVRLHSTKFLNAAPHLSYVFHHPNTLIKSNSSQRRDFSLQSTIDSIAKTQTGVFKTISESTPVEYLQKLLLTLHDTTGLPWWASIVCTTVLLRTCVTLPLAIYQQYILAKLENLKLEMPDIVKELKRETAMAVKMYNWDERMARITYNRSVSSGCY